jgi:hypothetical protein
MTVMKYSWLWMVLCSLLFSVDMVSPLLAQDNPVTATVDRTNVGTDETFNLTVAVNGTTGAAQPELPVLDGIQVLSSSSSTQVSIINGKASSQVAYTYLLQATRAGDLEIPAITVNVDGQNYATAPISIHVTQGAAPPAPAGSTAPGGVAASQSEGGDFFVEAAVDQPTLYLGQQLIYTFRFYQAVDLFDQPSYKPPEFGGFWHGQKSEQSQAMTNVGGRTYRVTTLTTMLFPTTAGERTIEPAHLTIPDSVFQRGGALQTAPVTVTVKPLPEPAPAGFNGAVGQIVISATVDVANAKVNEPVTLHITLQGKGNVETWPEPTLPTLTGWRVFNSTAKSSTNVVDGQLTGSRRYEQLLVPTTAGELTIPAIQYVYFDPVHGNYQTASTTPFTINAAAANAETPIPRVTLNDQSAVEPVRDDIRHIKSAPTVLRTTQPPLTSRSLYWAGWLLPLLLLGADFVWRGWQERRGRDPVALRRSQAQKQAQQRLAQARKQATDPHQVVGPVLIDYLSAKLNQPLTGLTQNALADRLSQHGIDASLVEQVTAVLTRSEIGRFAPLSSSNAAGDLWQAVTTLLAELEKVLP